MNQQEQSIRGFHYRSIIAHLKALVDLEDMSQMDLETDDDFDEAVIEFMEDVIDDNELGDYYRKSYNERGPR